MDASSIHKAKLLAAVICRVADYHAAASTPTKTDAELQRKADFMVNAEQRVAVALENMIDEGVLE